MITLVRGLAGKKQVYKDTCQMLGLNKTWRTTEKPNNASVRGMVQRVGEPDDPSLSRPILSLSPLSQSTAAYEPNWMS